MAEKFIGPDGTIYEALPGGGYQIVPQQGAPGQGITIGTPDPSAALDRAAKQLNVEKALREARTAPVQDARDEVALQAARINLEADRRKLSEQPTGKPLRQGDGDALEKQVGTYAALKGALGSFNNDYAGNSVTGGLENKAQRLLGTGTPGQSDWWANFAATDNVIRNSLYGASLTDGEKQAYDATTINPSMRPELIRQNLERRSEIVRGALGRKINRFKAGGYNPAEIDAATGEFGSDFAPGYKPQKQAPDTSDKTTKFYGNAAAANGDGGGNMQLATGTQTVADPVLKGVNAKVNGMLKSGASDDEIRNYIVSTGANASPASVAAALDFRRKNRGYKGNYSVNLESKDIPLSTARQAFQSVGAGPVGAYATGAADALTAGRLDNIAGAMGGNAAQVDAAKALLAKANPISSLAGNVTGGALAAGGIELGLARSGLTAAGGIAGRLARAPLASDTAYGAAVGSDDPNNPLAGAALGAVTGLGGGYIGQRAAGAIGGVGDAATQRLRQQGVQMSLGQAVGRSGRVGSIIKSIEDGMSGIPVIGSMVNARRAESLRSWNMANARQAAEGMAPITEVGERGAEQLDQAVTNAYAPLDNYSASVDPQLGSDLAAAAAAGNRIPGRGDDFNYVVNERMVPNFNAAGVMSGRNFQDTLRSLRKAGANQGVAAMHPDAFSGALRQVDTALTGMFQRQAPETTPILDQANRIFRNQSVLDNAVKAAKNVRDDGDAIYTPAQLNTASVRNATTYGGANNAATTNRPFYQSISDAQEILPNKVPDSGTAGRLALTGVLAGGGAGAGYLGDDTKTGLATGSLIAALQTQAAQRALVRMVLDRPQGVRRASDWLVENGVGAAIGGPVALSQLPGR